MGVFVQMKMVQLLHTGINIYSFLLIMVIHGAITSSLSISFRAANLSIRLIWLDGHYVFVGTKVHPQYGGIWRVDLERYEIKRIKKTRE
ncbi:hypothetical protein KHA80_15005 [Anaerobacillus sp. HL2]|nr:hypothetical protein KHA80_15005 [Anaerobacillus sp. HL2]